MLSLDGKLSEESQKKIEKLEREIAAIKSPELSEKNTGVLLWDSGKIRLDLRKYEPAKEAANLQQPILILQGERDYQVTMEIFDFYFLPKSESSVYRGQGQERACGICRCGQRV